MTPTFLALTLLFACGDAAPEAAPAAKPLPKLEMPTEKTGVPRKGPRPTLGGPNAMSRDRKAGVAGQAELLAKCLGEHDTTGVVTLSATVAGGKVTTAEVTENSGASEPFAACLAEHAVGMPLTAEDGAVPLTLTAM